MRDFRMRCGLMLMMGAAALFSRAAIAAEPPMVAPTAVEKIADLETRVAELERQVGRGDVVRQVADVVSETQGAWHVGPMPADTWHYGGVVLKGQEPSAGFRLADFKGDHVLLLDAGGSFGPKSRRVEAADIAYWNNSLTMPIVAKPKKAAKVDVDERVAGTCKCAKPDKSPFCDCHKCDCVTCNCAPGKSSRVGGDPIVGKVGGGSFRLASVTVVGGDPSPHRAPPLVDEVADVAPALDPSIDVPTPTFQTVSAPQCVNGVCQLPSGATCGPGGCSSGSTAAAGPVRAALARGPVRNLAGKVVAVAKAVVGRLVSRAANRPRLFGACRSCG